VNWEEVVRYFVRTVEADAAADGTAESAALLERLLNYPGVRSVLKAPILEATSGPVVPMRFRKDKVNLSLFTILATLGTPRDITLQELRIESFFAMDDATAKTFRDWSAL
jgi:hypothetical protein